MAAPPQPSAPAPGSELRKVGPKLTVDLQIALRLVPIRVPADAPEPALLNCFAPGFHGLRLTRPTTTGAAAQAWAWPASALAANTRAAQPAHPIAGRRGVRLGAIQNDRPPERPDAGTLRGPPSRACHAGIARGSTRPREHRAADDEHLGADARRDPRKHGRQPDAPDRARRQGGRRVRAHRGPVRAAGRFRRGCRAGGVCPDPVVQPPGAAGPDTGQAPRGSAGRGDKNPPSIHREPRATATSWPIQPRPPCC